PARHGGRPERDTSVRGHRQSRVPAARGERSGAHRLDWRGCITVRPVVAALVAAACALGAPAVYADGPAMFGASPKSAGVASSDVAAADSVDAARINPALVAAPGTRVRLSYGYAGMGLAVSNVAAHVDDVGGVSLAAQTGSKIRD